MQMNWLAVGCLLPAVLAAQIAPRPEIMVLGTFHMSNPGHDVHSTSVDDILSTTRQSQIEEVIGVLKRFKPTKVAVEADVGSRALASNYEGYVAGRYVLGRNEIDQLGYRLAKELGHNKIYGVDADGDFPLIRVRNYAIANNRRAEFDSVDAVGAASVKRFNEYLHGHTVLEALSSQNSTASVADDLSWYFGLVPFGETWEFAGPDLVAAFYQRNMRIYHNIRALVESPNERVLVIFGSGHLGWLREDVSHDSRVTLRKLSDFADRQ